MAKKEGSFAGWLQRVRKTGEHSDVTVKIQGQEFKLHMLPLVNESRYFQSLAANSPASTTSQSNSSSASSSGAESSAAAPPPPPPDRHHKRHHHHHHNRSNAKNPRVVAIDELPGGAAAFAIAADFCYIIRPSYSFANVAPVRAAAEFLGMADLVDSTKKFLYSSVFVSWKSCAAFLRDFERVYPSTDDYIESRALKVVTAAATKAFLDTKHVSVPLSSLSVAPPPPPTCAAAAWHVSPSHNLKDILVAIAALPDRYSRQLLDLLVASDTNLSIKCRQSRSVREWLDYLVTSECKRVKARTWIVLCLSRMLLKNAPKSRPWLELSSQYWCSLLEHAAALLSQTDDHVAADDLAAVKAALERRIGASLHELDDYIQAYSFEPETLLALVRHFIAERRRRKGGGGDELDQEVGEVGGDELEEEDDDEDVRDSEIDDSEGEIEAVASEVDGCLWGYAESGAISTATFVALEAAFPRESRGTHDMLFSAVERMLAKRRLGGDDVQTLWKFVDCSRLSAPVYERAMSNPSYLSQPHVLECVLRRHGNELEDDPPSEGGSSHDLKDIMHKVIKASLKLLEENSRRSKEIKELQRQFAGLVSSGFKVFPSREDHDLQQDSPDSFDVIPPPAPAPVVAPPPRHGNSEIREIQS